MTRFWPRHDTKAATTVEFAIIGWMLCMVTFAIIETGLLWWLKTGMQFTAAMTARCGAIGYTFASGNNVANFACTTNATTLAYANTVAPSYLLGMTIDVTLNGTNGKVTSCNGFTGNFFSVSVSHDFSDTIPPPLSNYAALSTNACYPMP